MAHTYEELRHMTVARLREIAEGIEDESLKGANALPKTRLLPILCAALGVETHEHHEVVGIDKGKIKARIKQLKAERDAALGAHDHAALKRVRRDIHKQKRTMRRSMA